MLMLSTGFEDGVRLMPLVASEEDGSSTRYWNASAWSVMRVRVALDGTRAGDCTRVAGWEESERGAVAERSDCLCM
jgi:hypothetical protein